MLEKTFPLELFTRFKITPVPRGLLPKGRNRTTFNQAEKPKSSPPPLEIDSALLPKPETKRYKANKDSRKKRKEALAKKRAEAAATMEKLFEIADIARAEREIESRKRRLNEAAAELPKQKTRKGQPSRNILGQKRLQQAPYPQSLSGLRVRQQLRSDHKSRLLKSRLRKRQR